MAASVSSILLYPPGGDAVGTALSIRTLEFGPQQATSSTDAGTTRVLLGGSQIFLRGMSWLLTHTQDLTLVATAATLEELDDLAGRIVPDVAVVDLDLPDDTGLAMIARMRQAEPRPAILSLASSDTKFYPAIRAGALGFALTQTEPGEMISAIRSVACGAAVFGSRVAHVVFDRLTASAGPGPFPHLTHREHEVLDLLARGLDNNDIAQRLRIKSKTVRNHISAILAKLNVTSRSLAIVRARNAGLGASGGR